METIRTIYASQCSGVRFDKDLVDDIVRLEQRFVNKNEEHITFFGGTLTGVQVVRFLPSDTDILFTDILMADSQQLQDQVHALHDINPEWKVSSDIFAISCIWLMNGLANSRYLNDEQRQRGMIATCMYLQYRYLTSILSHFFQYPAKEETARATYAALSGHFGLKEYGSWYALLQHNAEITVDPHGTYAARLWKMSRDYDVVELLNAIQGRLKSTIINIYEVFMDVQRSGVRISSTSSLVEIDGEVILRDKVGGAGQYSSYLRSILGDVNSFFKPEIFDIICDIVPSSSPSALEQFLRWMSGNHVGVMSKRIDRVVERILEHSHLYLSKHRGLVNKHHDLVDTMSKLRGTYTSSHASEPILMEIKNEMQKLVTMATGVKGEALVAAIRTAACLYIVLRAYSKNHYS